MENHLIVDVLIDRITFTGTSNKSIGTIINLLGPDWEINNGIYELKRYHLDDSYDVLARIFLNKYSMDSYRMDFNPANLDESHVESIKNAMSIFADMHFTRLDVAFDVKNCKNFMNYGLYRSNISTTSYYSSSPYTEYASKLGKLETKYWGKSSSRRRIRMYDKLVEQQVRNKEIPDGVDSWGRLEIQLRGSKTDDWIDDVGQMLSEFKLPKIHLIKNKSDAESLFCIEHNVRSYADYSKEKRARLRRLQTSAVGFDDSLSKEMEVVFNRDLLRLQQQLNDYLAKFGASN